MAGMERLSPMVRNSSVRRLSLDLCQKFGSQLLSPNFTSEQLSSSLSPPQKENFSPFTQTLQSHHGPLGKNNQTGSKRRCSDSYSHFYNVSETFGNSPQRSNTSRRKSLSPLNLQNLSLSFQSPLAGNGCNIQLGISAIPASPDFNDPKNVNLDQGWSGLKGIVKNVIPEVSPEKPGVVYNVIPPTPGETERAGNSSEEEGRVFKRDEVPIRRTSLARLNHGQRRKSSTTRYDFDDEFLKFVLLRSKLHLSPEQILGRGSFGTVVAGTYRGKAVAVKVIKTKSEKRLESMKGEENALSLPSHPHITKHIEIVQIQPDKCLVVLERLEKGNLLAVINDLDVEFDIRRAIQISLQISSALNFCHRHGILHLDVKPQNVLLDFHGTSKLSDFGNSKRIRELKNQKDFTKLDGTVAYKAPELFRGACPTTKSDVFSLAISMWQMMTRETPYMSETEHSVIYKVVAQKLRPKAICTFRNSFGQQRSNKLAKDFTQLYELCWETEPDLRPSMETVFHTLSQLC